MGWISRLVNVFRKDRLTGQIDEELEFHLAARAEDNIASGMKTEEARQDARRRFGNPALTLENVRDADPQQPWDAVESMRQIIYDSESLSLRRPIVRLLGAFALIALILAGAGLFAVLSHSVAERRREIGIRMAVGARQTQVLRQIAGDTCRFTLPGALIGAVSAYALSALLPTGHIGWSGSGVFLYGVGRSDAVTYFGVFFGQCFISIAATFIPARRAMRVDPSVALREE